MPMPGRFYSIDPSKTYRYGMNGQENSSEIFEGATTAEYWEYDSRLGRRWNIDPLAYDWQSPYACFNNNPVYYKDPKGLEGDPPVKQGQPVDLGNGQTYVPSVDEVNVCVTCGEVTSSNPLAAASTSNIQPIPSTPQNNAPGNYYEGVWQISYNTNLISANNFNTQNQSVPQYLGEPGPMQYMQTAQDLSYNGGASVGWKGFGLNTEGDATLGYKDPNVTVNLANPEVKSVGGYGATFSTSGFEIGPVKATSESSVYSPGPYIVHNQTGQVTGTVQASFIIQNIQAAIFVGGFSSKVTAVRSFSSTNGGVTTQTIGTTRTKGVTFGIKGPANIGTSFDIPLQSK